MSEDALTIRSMRLDHTLCALVSGDLDLINAQNLSSLSEMFGPQTRLFILDLTNVGYIDSIGLRSVLSLQRAAEAARTPMTVHVRSRSNVHRVMRVVGVDSLLNLVTEDHPVESGPNPPSSRL